MATHQHRPYWVVSVEAICLKLFIAMEALCGLGSTATGVTQDQEYWLTSPYLTQAVCLCFII